MLKFSVGQFGYRPEKDRIDTLLYVSYARLINTIFFAFFITKRFDFVVRLFPSRYWPRRDSEKPRGKILILGILFSVGTTPKGYNTNNFEENFS